MLSNIERTLSWAADESSGLGRLMKLNMVAAAVAAICCSGAVFAAQPAGTAGETGKPDIVLVHGVFAESSSWDAVIPKLAAKGYNVIAVANPLRSLRRDSKYVAGILRTIKGPVVLVGHSYGGSVITNAAHGHRNVKALVYVDGTAPEAGESTAMASGRFPGSTLGTALAPPIMLPANLDRTSHS